VGEGIPPLLDEIVRVNADGMLDAKPISVVVVDEFETAVSTVPLWIATQL